MSPVAADILLAVCLLAGLPLVLFGLPGLWVMVLGVIGYGALTGFRSVGAGIIGAAVALAFLGEIVEWWLGFRFAERYGGSRRAAWGAVLGGMVGAGAGIPLPVLGSVIGAFVGSFVGAALFEFVGMRDVNAAVRVGFGAVIGRVAGAAIKVALGLVIAVLGVVAVFRG
ncbi:MAG TPA: DUF456 domain-containing protein [Gemmatimonadales bacterium]|nr:DUF456 domain-containing protein [Gemmatimonadales bacterium]